MRLLLHPDPHTLEAELLRGVAAVKHESPFAPVLVVVPTLRLARHVERRLAERLGAVAAVDVLTYRGTARRVHRAAGIAPPDRADPRLLEGVLDGVLERRDRGDIASFVRRRPAALGSLLGTLRELREAGVPPDAVAAAGAEDLAAIHAAYLEALAARRPAGLLDEADWVAEATAAAAEVAGRWRAVFHHGAYELVGMHLDLLLAIDRGTEVTWLAPVAPGSRATAYAEAFFRRQLPGPFDRGRALETEPGSPLGSRLAALYDEAASPPALPEAARFLALATAQGTEPEVEHALRGALARTAAGVPPGEIAVLARSLEPYAAALEAIVSRDDLPADVEWSGPLRREPALRDFLFLLRAVADDFPRALTAEVLRSTHLRWPSDDSGGADLVHAEAWSRSAGIVGGLASWEGDLPAWAAERASEDDAAAASRIGAVLRDAHERLVPAGPRTWSGHEAAFLDALDAYLPDGHAALRETFLTLGDLERLAGDSAPVPFGAAVACLERFVDRSSVDAIPPSPGGIAVVDVMQARGLTFEEVAVLGLNAGQFPRRPREDPFLGDEARAQIRRATGRPLGVKREAESEERQLLASVLGSARRRLHVSWQRADDSGRARAASLALREIARLVTGSPDLGGLRLSAPAVPSHPRERILHLTGATGLLRADEAVLVAALDGRADAGTAGRVRALDERLADGLDMLLATEAFEGRRGEYDGRVGRAFEPRRGFAVTSLERLGACPLQFFFRDVLRARELDEEADPYEAEARDMGARVHDLLRELYATLHAEGALGTTGSGALRRALEILDARWDAHMGPRGTRAVSTFPVLHRIETRRWRRALAAFLGSDLSRLAEAGVTGAEFETDRDGEIALSDGKRIRVHGRIDRFVRTANGAWVGEYKTSGKIERRGDPTEMLRGTALQAPLYHLLTEGASVEVLGVGPAHDPAEGATEKDRVAVFGGWTNDEQRRGFVETLGVLASLPQRGTYPLLEGPACRWCAYTSACRKDHAPTALRHEREDADLRDLRRKNKSRAPTLARVRGEAGE